MITKTLNLDDAYQALFQEVSEKSNGSINVDNIEAYFGSIQEIANLDSKFLRLPLDEPLFEIDANTRKITVPNEFKSNGLSVQGDHLAEIIFFRIERYFDYKDLSTCNIEINWKMGDKEGKTKRFIQFNDVMTIDEVKSNCIIFGWPVNNIITQKSGSLTFAVEFNQTETVEGATNVTYRFNTLPTTINIKDGLILGEAPSVYELDADIKKTLVNSSYGEGEAAVGDLVWITGNGKGLIPGVKVNDKILLGDFVSSINLPTVVVNGEPASEPIDFYAIAEVDSGTKIQYTDMENNQLIPDFLQVNRPLVAVTDMNSLDNNTIYYRDAAGLNRITPAEVAEAAETESPIETVWQIEALDNNLDYFVKVEEEGVESYQLASEDDLAKWGKITVIPAENEEEEDQVIDSVELYIKAAKITADKEGPYFIKAQGYKVDANEVKIGNGELETSEVVVVPEVEAPSAINIEVPDPVAPVAEENEKGAYLFNDDEIKNVVFLNNGASSVTATAVMSSDSKIGALQFVWQKENADNEFENISEESVEFSTLNSSALAIDEAGTYQVVVTNFQNSKKASPVTSNIIIASTLAQKINSAKVSYQLGSQSATNYVPANNSVVYNTSVMSRNKITLSIKPEDIVMAGEDGIGTLEYEWYDAIIDEETNSKIGEQIIAGANSNSYVVDNGDRKIIPVIKNNYHGSIYTLKLDTIDVDDRG